MAILQKSGVTGSLSISSSRLPVSTTGSLFSVDGYNGRLLNVVDTLTGSLFSVNTIAGLPAFEVLSNNTIIGGKYNNNDFVITGSNVGIGTNRPRTRLHVSGSTTVAAGYFQGNVGIGSSTFTSPGYKLEITGDARVTTNTYLATASGGVGIKTTSLNNHGLYVNGSLGLKTTTVNSTPYTATDTDCVIFVNTLIASVATAVTINLPAASGRAGRIYVIKRNMNGTSTITIDANGGETIDGALTSTITAAWGSKTIVCDGTSWFTISNVTVV